MNKRKRSTLPEHGHRAFWGRYHLCTTPSGSGQHRLGMGRDSTNTGLIGTTPILPSWSPPRPVGGDCLAVKKCRPTGRRQIEERRFPLGIFVAVEGLVVAIIVVRHRRDRLYDTSCQRCGGGQCCTGGLRCCQALLCLHVHIGYDANA